MCSKADKKYSHALEFLSECYKTQKICGKAVKTCSFTIKYVSD